MTARHGIDSARERLNADLPNALLVLNAAIARERRSTPGAADLYRLRLFVLTGRIGGAS